MGLLLLFLLISVSRSSTLPVEPNTTGPVRNTALEQLVLGLLENVREVMITGSDAIPILDPLQIDNLQVDENIINLPGAYLRAEDLIVNRLSTFVVDRLSISLTSILQLNIAIELELSLPILDVQVGYYDLSLSAMGLEVFGRGNGNAQLIGPKVSVRTVFALLRLSVSQTVVKLELDEFEPQLTGIFYHDGASDFANSFLKNLVPELVQFYEDDITGFLSSILEDLANQVLGNVFSGFRMNKKH